MSKAEENRKSLQVKLLDARLKSYYNRIKSLHDHASKMSVDDAEEVQMFLELTTNLSVLRTEFNSEFNELTLIKMELSVESEPNMTALEAFEREFVAVQSKVNAILRPGNSNKPTDKTAPRMKLPPVELPKFDGSTKSWPMFIECFNNMIHLNPQLSSGDKVYYLCGQLKDKALETIAGIAPTSDNYELMYAALVNKYQDVRSLGTAYLEEMFNLKKMLDPSVDGLNSFMAKFSVSVSAFEKLNIPDKLDFVFLYLALKKVDNETARLFENSVRNEKIPSYESFAKFVREQAKIIERTGVYTSSGSGKNVSPSYAKVPVPMNSKPSAGRATRVLVTSNATCPVCKKSDHDHFSRCAEFLDLSTKERYNVVKQSNGCVLCLGFSHKPNACNVKGSCNTCRSRTHHTLLHFDNVHSSTALPVSGVNQDVEMFSEVLSIGNSGEGDSNHAGVSLCSLQSLAAHESVLDSASSTVLLATARVRVVDSSGNVHLIRCLIDNGSQNHFITTQCCKRLSLITRTLGSPMSVHGFGGNSNHVIGETELEFCSRFDRSRPYKVRPLVVDSITQRLPTSVIDKSMLGYLKGVPLADDTFDRPGEIEMLIGAQLFSRLILAGRIYGPPGRPDALQTTLGFIVMGEVPLSKPEPRNLTSAFCAFTGPRLDELVRSFWELEEVPSCTAAKLSSEEQECEQFYKSTTTRDSTGRYTVGLPFKSDPTELGSSLNTAEKRFFSLERKFRASPQLREAYDKVIREYLELGYLAPVNPVPGDVGYVIPHHAVVRDDKVTTKLRIVLDASARTNKGLSLNQVLHGGPNLQGDIFLILLNFRLFPVAYGADVKQMYLQIKVHSQYHKYLRMLYRFDPNDKLQTLEFDRVCFGVSSSPFLALRTVKQLCDDESSNFPLASNVAQRDLYMDDIVSSEISVSAATETALELIGLFKAGGFDLMKWSSNSSDLLSRLPETHLHPQVVQFDKDSGQKILGVRWEPRLDVFSFNVTTCEQTCTKRNILSTVARLWDILGFAAPVILYAKLLIQELWKAGIEWDQEPPPSIVDKWTKFQLELPLLSQMSIPRHVGVVIGCVVTLLGFSDASEKAYGAVIYLHIQSANGIVVRLLCAKSRVAPLKSITLARLELCGALLLAKLIRSVLLTYESRWKIDRIFAFADSTVALHWIHASPHRWKTFVANRVARIQESLDSKCFYHIAGKENPSDCLSRGLTPAQLLEHPLWLKGPPWVAQDPTSWPVQPFQPISSDIPEAKPEVVLITLNNKRHPILYELSQRVSSWPKLLRIVVYVLRFVRKLKTRGLPQVEDLSRAEAAVICSLQTVHFADAMRAVRAGKACTGALQRLRPIIVDEVLRVGGRLENANLTFDHKHPILLPRKDHVVELIIDDTHRRNCHTGPHLLLSILRQRFWILSGRNLVRSRVHLCNFCFRARPKACIPPVMADLPECRLQISKPFAHTGLDYCGPLSITLTRKRGVRSQKAYICVFICLTTRAVHVELVPDLSTDAFLNALKRFVSRRGPVEKLMSDNGTNFVGARAYLNELDSFLQSETHRNQWNEELSHQRIRWQMIPPNAPHFGGGWESTVKAFKTHLFRVIGSQILTYEELLTVLCQIEAVLNSRPLGRALSPDPAEPLALTPAHFLHTTPLGSLPSAPVPDDREHLLSRYLLLDKLVQSYWRRWSLEYLHTLQTREKWLTDTEPIKKGTIVIIMQNNTAVLHWPLGVVQETYPGSDRRTRIVLVKTKSGTLMRPIARLCPLPSQ